jgi:hypothetical protein
MAKKQPLMPETLIQRTGFKADIPVPELDFDRVVLGFLPDKCPERAHQNKNDSGAYENDRAWFLIFHRLLHDVCPSNAHSR